MHYALRSICRHDLPASLVVFLVALPLSLGIAMASGAPALAGLTAAVVSGLVVGVLGGSPLLVSGPSAAMTVVVAGLVDQFGWAVTCAMTAAAGMLQLLLGLTRVARAALAIAPVVVHAMLAGIGITIALQQLHVLLGGESKSSAWRNIVGLPGQLVGVQGQELILGVVTIGVLIAWQRVPAPLSHLPGPLVGIVGVTVLSVVLPFDVDRVTFDGSLADAVHLPTLPTGGWGGFAAGVVTVALIASVQSLLTAAAVDRMNAGPRTDFDRELVAQGVGNIVCGALGGLPIAGVMVRSSANIDAGARTRASAILHAIWILLFALPFAALVQRIPTAALAGLLVVIGVQLLNLAHIETARRNRDFTVYLVTVLGVVFGNLLDGVLIGLLLAIAFTGWRVIRAEVDAVSHDDDAWTVRVSGACTFLSVPALTRVLAGVPTGASVTVDVQTSYLDHAAQQAIDDWRQQHCATGGTVGVRQPVCPRDRG
ncbi:SulP family inorganic anion transporter [Mycobacterium sp. M1]|uniref:SulP family inorganic anion transporter n=1 Tax=Mycolicibacter acidiphilus TaxID=2835306 RepID=A0ABS5RHY5_9MYCO|nr:SulP family inorganic anion transporter [Mycolicibacter acidiphilus]MBS9533917.1 SulP family inorganic anion transporter [Mycolicibacter acidiphilus]